MRSAAVVPIGALLVVGCLTAGCAALPSTQPAGNPAVSTTAPPTDTTPTTPETSDTTAPSSSAEASGSAGTLLGSYSVTLPAYGGTPLGPTASTQADVLAHSGTGGSAGRDIVWQSEYGGSPLGTGNGDQMLSLPNGSTPTYQACTTDTLATESVSSNAGTAFCILETAGRVVGVTVKSVSIQSPANIVLDVMVWQK